MNKRTFTTGIVASALGLVALGVGLESRHQPRTAAAAEPARARPPTQGDDKIQIALLLDTSGSMDGLIGQARSQLWKVVNEYARATRNGRHARLEIALYEYGNDSLSEENGFVRQVLPFTSDLDKVSEQLFALTTNGGDEYCGQVIGKATSELAWSTAPGDLHLMFIAGNEPFNQGPLDYHVSIAAARDKGIRVNTIHCGGDEASWRDGALVARGEFLMIDQDQVVAHIAAPQDEEIARLGIELNATYVPYGASGSASYARQSAQDSNVVGDRGASLERSVSKANAQYDNAGWDLVDACRHGAKLAELPAESLPAEMRGLDAAGRQAFVDRKRAERERLQKRINQLNAARTEFVARKRAALGGDALTSLDAAMIRVAHEQGRQAGYRFE